MRWRGRRRSSNVEDRRGLSGGGKVVGGGIGMIIMVIVALLFGVDPSAILSLLAGGGGQPAPEGSGTAPPEGDTAAAFVEVVLAETEATWSEIFRQGGGTYQEPRLVLFDGAVRSACGVAGSAVGPFYCPGDRQVYLDLSFFRELARRFDAPGDFARAYVIAHEVGHHVQNLLGTSDEVLRRQRGRTRAEANALSVRLELQADCYAGVWAHHARREAILEPGDVEEAMGAASAIGDDAIQRRTQGQVVPESFTHGSSEQRVRWFTNGMESGDPASCNTFEA